MKTPSKAADVTLALLAGGRAALGLALATSPRAVAAGWLGEDAERPGTAVAVRGLGARDMALAGGLVAARLRRRSLRPWLYAAIASDSADVAAALAAGDELAARSRAGTALLAGASAIAGGILAALET